MEKNINEITTWRKPNEIEKKKIDKCLLYSDLSGCNFSFGKIFVLVLLFILQTIILTSFMYIAIEIFFIILLNKDLFNLLSNIFFNKNELEYSNKIKNVDYEILDVTLFSEKSLKNFKNDSFVTSLPTIIYYEKNCKIKDLDGFILTKTTKEDSFKTIACNKNLKNNDEDIISNSKFLLIKVNIKENMKIPFAQDLEKYVVIQAPFESDYNIY